ncbi:MAG: translation elongation factor Ts [Actinobacteria bacterium]|nr:translation elongation factor Ts [Actinomycetota bacterium]
MSEIPAALVKELRGRTGAGMMDCKRALQEAEGDIEAAHKLLREWGAAQAGKRAGRETTEGVVLVRISGDVGTLIAVGSETEPVSKNEEFQAYASRVLERVESDGPDAVSSLEDDRAELIAKIGENVVVRGAARLEAANGERLAEYVHQPASKIGVLLKAEGGSDEAGRRVAMHIASAAPRWVERSEVPAEEVEAERRVYASSDEVQSKPEQAREKIVEGMVNKRFFAAYPGGALLEQPWIHDTGKTVAQALEEEGIRVLAFERFDVGE